jgi:hypothetical protein
MMTSAKKASQTVATALLKERSGQSANEATEVNGIGSDDLLKTIYY